ncbi:adenylate/guanylate cyclase domain-containing protein [Lacibacter sediminis]|uniref:Adenylate/guanylate cyclase domain-containing protein n=1 Tax=Lacibacter sediminis TaxID=2760713 RepID=A0A7G5XGR8_9BACT|nr:adenylate/guanylate cyclase domain-containing protein [Lacibacter sediminis]QNA44671.1 adenylate/guanylate cyclase domain-containing protein [Lacibacter sediminis]
MKATRLHLQLKKAWFITGLFLIGLLQAPAQDQQVADSLANIYREQNLPDTAKLRVLNALAFYETRNLDLALQYAQEAIALATRLNDYINLHKGYFQTGNKKRLKGDLTEAITAYFKSIEAARKANYLVGMGKCYSAIADIYSISNNHKNAMLYYRRGIDVLLKANDSLLYATAVFNAGDELLKRNYFDSALVYFKKSGTIFSRINYLSGIAYNMGNLGMVYAHLGNPALAEQSINTSIKMLEEQEDYSPVCTYLLSMSSIYEKKKEFPAAFNYAQRSLQLALAYDLKEERSKANEQLSILYEATGNKEQALMYYKEFIRYRDSVNNLHAVQQMADLRTDYEVSKKQVEVDLLHQQKRNQRNILISLAVILLLTIAILTALFRFYKIIAREKQRSEKLLLNILPAETAAELKAKGTVDAVKFDEVTVLFTDFVQFSKQAEHIAPEVLVKSIDAYFRKFDEVSTAFGLEKIKTVGDSYMCAGGLPTVNKTHATDVVAAALQMNAYVTESLNKEDGLAHFEIRIGIHTGPVIAGIVGIKKWQYDIWGDTVNIASRMESAGMPGKVNCSESTMQIIRKHYVCEYRGEIEVKNRGSLNMYFITGEKKL